MKKLPILIVIPHGGYNIPEELVDYAIISQFELFIFSDTGANEIFSFEKEAHVVKSSISKLFMDLNRSPVPETGGVVDGVIKKKTPYDKDIYEDGVFPDEFAISNLIKRYHTPFFDNLKKILKENDFKIVLECHTVPTVSENSPYIDNPNPVFQVYNRVCVNRKTMISCPDVYAEYFLSNLKKNFSGDSQIKEHDFIVKETPLEGYVVQQVFNVIPYLRIDVSKSLFFNETYFNYDYLKIDQIRIGDIRKRLWVAIERFFLKFFSE